MKELPIFIIDYLYKCDQVGCTAGLGEGRLDFASSSEGTPELRLGRMSSLLVRVSTPLFRVETPRLFCPSICHLICPKNKSRHAVSSCVGCR